MKRLTEKAVAEKIQDLRNIGYTHDGAVEWASTHTFYEIDTVEVQE
jgi:biotin operon repressor